MPARKTAASSAGGDHLAGYILIVTAVAAVALLMAHPEGGASDFAGMLKQEAADQKQNAIVHGGYLFVLAVQIVCYALFSARLTARSLATAGIITFAIGAAFMMGSLLVDGLMMPAIAAKYAGAADKLEYAKSLFVFGGIAVQFLMPLGLFFQAAGMVLWGGALVQQDVKVMGWIALVLGLVVVGSVAGAFGGGMMLLMMVAIGGLALWAALAGVTMVRRMV